MRNQFITFFLAIFSWHSCIAGNEHSGGDVFPPEYGSAWFLGADSTIHACYELSPNFGVAAKEVETTLTEVFASWKKYYNDTESFFMQEKELLPAFNLNIIPQCNGSEDIKFYFGTSDESVEKVKAQYNNPTAFADRTSFDLNKGWGKGFLWVSGPKTVPKVNWTVPHAFFGILLHEVGHVYGCEHVEGTIMTENISNLLYTGPMVTKIDGYRTLVSTTLNEFKYNGYIGAEESVEEQETFKLFTGRNAVGNIWAKVEYNGFHKQLTLFDQSGSTALPIELIKDDKTFSANQKAFKAVAKITSQNSTKLVESWVKAGIGKIQFSTVTAQSGQKYPIVIIHNSDSNSPLEIKYFGTGKSLFKASYNSK